MTYDIALEKSLDELEEWYEDQKSTKTVVCVGLAIAEIMREAYPLTEADWLTDENQVKTNGELIRTILARHGEERTYAEMGGRTTRSAPVSARALADRLNNVSELSALTDDERENISTELQTRLFEEVREFFNRQKIKPDIQPLMTFPRIIGLILEIGTDKKVSGAVAQHLVGAKLAVRFPDKEIDNFSTNTADQQLDRPGDFCVGDTAIHVTMAPGAKVIRKCIQNISNGYRPLLLVPYARLEAARQLVANENESDRVNVLSLEEFIGQNMDEMAGFSKNIGDQLRALIESYNSRIEAVETDLSLQVELPTNL